MKILLIKMSSMGDVFHTFPALTDALSAYPDLQVDWIVEKGFSEIPSWHPAVKTIFPIELRAWRKNVWKNRHTIRQFFEAINPGRYDLIIDAQGLIKSAWVARKLRAAGAKKLIGLDWYSAREPLASLVYQQKISVDKNQHAVTRLRQLFASTLGYSYSTPDSEHIDYGLKLPDHSILDDQAFQSGGYHLFLHGTTWDTKLWPESYWIELGLHALQSGQALVLLWGTEEEKARALRIQTALLDASLNGNSGARVWVPGERLSLLAVAHLLKNARQIVSVDTGLSHVSAALEVPISIIYRVTDPAKIGAKGNKVVMLASPVAPHYVKQFRDAEQEAESLVGIQVEDVIEASECLGH